MPYGLASALLTDENPEASDRFKRRYNEIVTMHKANAQCSMARSRMCTAASSTASSGAGDAYE